MDYIRKDDLCAVDKANCGSSQVHALLMEYKQTHVDSDVKGKLENT